VLGSELVGRTYDGPFDELPIGETAKLGHRVIPWSEVAATEGTGIVHIAPGCGKEDFQLGKELGLPVVAPITIPISITITVLGAAVAMRR